MIDPVITWSRPTEFKLDENKRRIKIVVLYDGTCYFGFQYQDNLPTIQDEIEKAIYKLTKEKVRVFCSGRTDSKVHATFQVCHFDIENKSIKNFKLALNGVLPKDIRIKEDYVVDEKFHSRFSTLYREYTYRVKNYDNLTPFDNNYVYVVRSYPDLKLLNEYASVILGVHDFTSFCSSKDESTTRVRDVYECYWKEEKDFFGNTELHFIIKANAFLWNMIRTLCGTMIECGRKGMTKQEFYHILESKDRTKAGVTASSSGLYLSGVWYAKS